MRRLEDAASGMFNEIDGTPTDKQEDEQRRYRAREYLKTG
jgi:hypothetical protein